MCFIFLREKLEKKKEKLEKKKRKGWEGPVCISGAGTEIKNNKHSKHISFSFQPSGKEQAKKNEK